MQPLLSAKAPLHRRQVNPAAFSGVTDQISNIGTSAGHKAAHATAGLTRTQVFMVVVMCIIGLVLGVAALWWVCSLSRRRKRAREMQERSTRLTTEMVYVPSSGGGERNAGKYGKDGWGESSVALNEGFVAGGKARDDWEQGKMQHGHLDMPRTLQQTYRF